ncbi:unnamed protein product [Ectocarpus sp. 12 AP-2014]
MFHCCCSTNRVSLVQRWKQVVLLLLLMLLILAREDAVSGVMGVEMIEVKGGCLQVTLKVRPLLSFSARFHEYAVRETIQHEQFLCPDLLLNCNPPPGCCTYM